jgi:hypothetical protein
MSVLISQEIPAPRQFVEAVSALLDAANDPPSGLIIHLATETAAGGVRIVDLWESEDAFRKFRADRLDPAVAKVMAEMGETPTGEEPPTTVEPAFDVVHGK